MLERPLSGELHVVTGAFGYSGRYVAGKLIEQGLRVRTLTNSLNRPNPFGDTIAREHSSTLGTHYASELARRRDRSRAYEKL